MGGDLFFIIRGSFELRRGDELVGSIGRKRTIGEQSFVRGAPYPFTLIAKQNSQVCKLTRSEYEKIMHKPEKYFGVIPLLEPLVSTQDAIARRSVADGSKVVKFSKGERITRHDEKAKQFYIILKGKLVSF